MTNQEAMEVVNAKVNAAKILVQEAKDLAQQHGISFEANINTDVDGHKTSDGWVSSSWNC